MKKIYLFLSLTFVSLSSLAQLQNLDFENWHNPIDAEDFVPNRPMGWIWTNGLVTSEDYYLYNQPHSDAHNNDYAVTLSIWYNHTKDALIQGAPIDYRPERLKGYYKYTDNLIYEQGNGEIYDTAMVAVYLTSVEMGTLNVDTIGIGKVNLSYSENYAVFEVNIDYLTDDVPQFITIYLDPSLVGRYEGRYYFVHPGPAASYFTVDNLSLEGEAVLSTDDINKESSISVYPNPAQNTLCVSLDEKQPISIYSTTGKLIEQYTAAAFHALDVSSYPSGIYIIKSNEGVTRFVKH